MNKNIAKILLETKAVSLRPEDPFTFASGIKSPIYCDNRLMMSYTEQRKVVVDSFVKILEGVDFDVLAGTATAGISWCAWIAEKLDKPMIYIRGKSKDYGKQNKIEGVLKEGQRVVLIEDLISTGGSSISAVESIREAGGIIDLCLAIFTYGQESSIKKFEETECALRTLTDLNVLVDVAIDTGDLNADDKRLLLSWQKDPVRWQS